MLTADLIRGTLRQGVVHPRFVKVDESEPLADATTLIDLFRGAEGDTVAELTEAIEATFVGRHDIQFIRGLSKLLMDLTDLESQPIATKSDPDKLVTPEAIRAEVFGRAAAKMPVRPGGGDGFTARETLIEEAASALDIRPEDLERGLYADLTSAQKVGPLSPLEGGELLERYNLALAQGCLFRAREVRVTLIGIEPRRLQALIRVLKFRRVLFRLGRVSNAPVSADDTQGTTVSKGSKVSPGSKVAKVSKVSNTLNLVLDGPLSLFKHTSRYGLALAQVLPELTRCEKWTLEADIRWGRERTEALLRLSDRSPLCAHTPDRGTWESAEERHLRESFAALETPWKLEPVARLVDLDGQDVLAPDYLLTHPDGRVALIELVFSWRLDAFSKRLVLLRSVGPKNLIVALTDRGRLDADRAELAESSLAIHRFKGLIQPRRLIELAEKVAFRENAEPDPASPPHPRSRKASSDTPKSARRS